MTGIEGFTPPLVNTAWLAHHLGEPNIRILDCGVVTQHHEDGSYSFASGSGEWRHSHIPGSIHVDVLEELSDPNQAIPLMMPPIEEFSRLMAELGVGDGTKVVLYDRSNHAWAARVWWMLRVCGFDDAAVLNGGWRKWLTERLPVSDAEERYPPERFTCRPRSGLMADRREVLSSIANSDTCLINALSPESFSGKLNNLPRAGRIPGSRNVYCQWLVDEKSGEYLQPEALRDRFAATGAFAAKRVITYCGGGIAASSDALALTLLGVKNVAVYDGSLSEWTQDPALPMETDPK
ncbi:MAG: sulfurtransferase [Gammaproteobacteria bacterium]|nr:MAG: sulfurtransferase [Gammaproteobacteria bacterium]